MRNHDNALAQEREVEVYEQLASDPSRSGSSLDPHVYALQRHPFGIEVTVYRSERDGRPVVQIDTDADVTPSDKDGVPAIRVYVNDGLVWDGPSLPPTEDGAA